ncbi:alpha/beta fold hydrolase [Fulvivirga ligni]|uniref:alpha/beta fold hydrolase n=1 Tax=Fulvivirga ligni TaxID=2904246 RepID=UPI001F44158B|nr:alpha/beta hydrolase [Fulvivirga ligni]UII22215.1 alpha/beta hydrolase [Fulvivirga ligni]
MTSHLKKTNWLAMAGIFTFIALNLQAQTNKPDKSGYVPVKDTKIYYETYGEGDPLILLHGSFYTIELNWAELIPELSKNRKVIAIEFQSHGHSPYSDRNIDFVTFAEDVEKVMDHLKIETADIAGYSMGGTVAYQFTVQYPQRVNRLVILSSTYKMAGWLPQVNSAQGEFNAEDFNNSPLKTTYDAVAPDKTKWPKFLEQMFVFAGETFNIEDSEIAKIKAPVLLISGDNDGIDKVELMKTYRLLGGDVMADMEPMPKSKLAIIPSQTHVGVMMQTEAISKYMNEFLD